MSDLNGHHQEWFLLPLIVLVAVCDFATTSGCNQLVGSQTNTRGGTLYLLMTDVPDLVRVSGDAPIGNSDHSSLSAVFRYLRLFQTWVLVGKFSSNTVCCAIHYQPFRNVWFDDNLLLRF